jgi:PAS domain S-box-containing protein
MLEVSEILNANILIVDDQQANVILLEQMLRKAGYLQVSSTMDPHQVCPLYQEHRYDLILLDLQMPELDGFQVMEGLKLIEPDAYLPVLVITAQPSHKLRALQAGAKDFVSKPFDLIEVQTRIHNMLEVRLLYRKLENYNKLLEQTVLERTAELRESEARFKSFTELSSDWYWEQDALGNFTKVSGPVFEMLGIEVDDLMGATKSSAKGSWNVAERDLLNTYIADRRPFLDFVYSRSNPDGTTQFLQVSGEPMFDSSSRFTGYRGIGMELTDRRRPDIEQLRFRHALDVIDQGVLLIDRRTMRVVDVNEPICRMLAYSQAEFLAVDVAELGLGSNAHLAAKFDVLISADAAQAESGLLPATVQTDTLRCKDGAALAAIVKWYVSGEMDNRIIVGMVEATKSPQLKVAPDLVGPELD